MLATHFRLVFIWISMVLPLTISLGQKSTETNPSKISGRQISNATLDSIFSDFDNKSSPGVAVTLVQGGKVIAKKDYGMASIELQVPFSHQSVVRIGYSEAREFISIAAVLMEKDGLISLNDKVRKYFPQLPDWSESVTLWDMLNHRSGFVDEWATLLLMHGSMANRFDKEQFFRLLQTQPEPQVEPGKGYLYCNSDFGLLRLVMEKASGKDLSEWIKQRVFGPLGMDDTRMQSSALDIVPNRANKYSRKGFEFIHDNVQKTSPGGNYFILTSADDLLKWSHAIGNPHSEFNTAFVKLAANVRTIPDRKNHYVTGFSIDTVNNHIAIIHEGVNGENYLTRVPSKDLTIITLGNLDGDGFAAQNNLLLNYLLNPGGTAFTKPIFATKPIAVNESELKVYEGTFRWLNQKSWESYNEIRRLSNFYVEDGKLKLRYRGNYVLDLVPVGKDLFYFEEDFGMEVKFERSKGSLQMRATVTFDDGYQGVDMEREAGQWHPSATELKAFIGKYYSRHLDYYWTFEINENGRLLLKRPTMPDAVLVPDGEYQFRYVAEKGPGDTFDQWIKFDRNADLEISGCTIWSARVMHHRFERE